MDNNDMQFLGPYQLGPNDTPENGIYTGDCRDLAKAIPDESIDLIFTDPVYDRIDDYYWLARCGARVLKDGASCLSWTGRRLLPDALAALAKGGLSYVWILAHITLGTQSRFRKYGLFERWQACLWFVNGEYSVERWKPDAVLTTFQDKAFHRWGKQSRAIMKYTEWFVSLDALVFDPLTGGGTVPAVCKMLGRRYLAFEIEPDVAEMARERVRDTQPPLFVLQQPEQTEIQWQQ